MKMILLRSQVVWMQAWYIITEAHQCKRICNLESRWVMMSDSNILIRTRCPWVLPSEHRPSSSRGAIAGGAAMAHDGEVHAGEANAGEVHGGEASAGEVCAGEASAGDAHAGEAVRKVYMWDSTC
ncbi:uncharacterized protein BJ212DRAFT_1296478 [Suillus subaureus]|uniref:Uncharacterized protein n=1 Tax=Suillus subaureus TaxID=48587 RepID=A0A9P7JIK2_9AGAM|nr:uncharacterized protein BJ212DRAFT_1296478 [Suillus subaureus]KAG1823966.1 hypothetical protein BJ212DRAFT_1296478 [Suillus subaureus]